ncbi:unnamed protein product [Prorocentrum cordatum]|uniref:Uncharacterized protein n=1 Tax=Prorocentrum cordatum TaxID=2364126 RepID=A0ABN9U1A2_9DINO|nr:unnamed protein product [Polarella glacialis]
MAIQRESSSVHALIIIAALSDISVQSKLIAEAVAQNWYLLGPVDQRCKSLDVAAWASMPAPRSAHARSRDPFSFGMSSGALSTRPGRLFRSRVATRATSFNAWAPRALRTIGNHHELGHPSLRSSSNRGSDQGHASAGEHFLARSLHSLPQGGHDHDAQIGSDIGGLAWV